MIQGISHITLAVTDLERAWLFYRDVLGCQPLARWRRGAYLLAGELWLCLSLDATASAAPRHDYSHVALSISESAFADWCDRLVAAQIPQWQPNTSEGNSLYILDPDGHKLELHCGSWQSRLATTKNVPYDGMEFFV